MILTEYDGTRNHVHRDCVHVMMRLDVERRSLMSNQIIRAALGLPHASRCFGQHAPDLAHTLISSPSPVRRCIAGPTATAMAATLSTSLSAFDSQRPHGAQLDSEGGHGAWVK